jgi:8-oxo-dGDP phosphatase
MALVFNDEGQVVLIQEAKENCRGKWYIPAGRVEPGENFIVSVKSFNPLLHIYAV